jgi:hypothetical protein
MLLFDSPFKVVIVFHDMQEDALLTGATLGDSGENRVVSGMHQALSKKP